jgi:hypothetical protein
VVAIYSSSLYKGTNVVKSAIPSQDKAYARLFACLFDMYYTIEQCCSYYSLALIVSRFVTLLVYSLHARSNRTMLLLQWAILVAAVPNETGTLLLRSSNVSESGSLNRAEQCFSRDVSLRTRIDYPLTNHPQPVKLQLLTCLASDFTQCHSCC